VALEEDPNERKEPMLRSLKDLEKYTVSATDGELGGVENFLLDDERWVVRYLVVGTGGLMGGRRMLISPIKSDKFLVVVHGTAESAKRAKEILDKTIPNATAVHLG
jgi:hypothetical protein